MLFPEKYSIFGKSIIGGTVKKLRTDRQTLNDLGIVESTYGEKTLFSLFDMTESDGGKRCLEEWLVHPLSDWKALHERQEAIRYPDFPRYVFVGKNWISLSFISAREIVRRE